VPLNFHALRRKEVRLQNVRRQNKCLEKAISLIAGGTIDPAWLATHTFALDEAQKAFTTAADRTDGVLKAVLKIG